MISLRSHLLAAACAAAFLTTAFAGSAHASFIFSTTEPGNEEKLFINAPPGGNKDVTAFSGTVGGNNTGSVVNVTTTGAVDTGSGFATIKPVHGGTLTDLTFSPVGNTLFSDFFFRAQAEDAGGVTIKVTDAQGNVQTLPFPPYPVSKDQDFGAIGVISKDETIQSVEILGSFKEVKQIDFSYATSPVPLPTSVMSFGTALATLGLVGGFNARRKKAAASA